MGRYRISITGHGIHHNGREDDADAMAKKLVVDMKEKGHDIEQASIEMLNQQGSDLMPPAEKKPVV